MKNNLIDGWVTILGHPVPKVKIVILLSVLLMGSIASIIGGFFYIQKLKLEAQERSNDWSSLSPARANYDRRMDPEGVEATNPLEALLRYHIEATGFDRITSLRVSGQYIAGNIALDLTIMGRNPSRFLQRLEYEDRQLTAGLVDGVLWYRQNSPLLAEENDNLTQINRVLMVMECAIPILAWQFKDKVFESTLQRLPDVLQNGTEVAILENRAFDDMVIQHQIDLRTGQELSRTSLVSVGESKQLIELIFAPAAKGMEYPFPSGYSVRINQTPICTAQFEDYGFNKGIALFLFEQP